MIAPLERGIPDFRCHESRRLKFAAHLHRHLELVLFLEGEATAFADTERCVLRPGDAFIVFPNQVHRYDPPYTEERSIIVIVEPDMIPALTSRFFDSIPASAHLAGFVTDELIALAERLSELKRTSSPFEEAERQGLLTVLFSRALAACKLASAHAGETPAFQAVVNYCTTHYTGELSLATLERELHISRYYISHIFADKLQIGFNDYVNSLRVSHACRYLKDEEHGITEIGALSGFSTPRTFNRAFLKQTGLTPSEYRKKVKEHKEEL